MGCAGLNIATEKASATGPVKVSGIFSKDTTWTAANSPYIVIGDILIEENVNLTIEPGVTIKFDADKYIRVDGSFYAVGTESQIITFTSNILLQPPQMISH